MTQPLDESEPDDASRDDTVDFELQKTPKDPDRPRPATPLTSALSGSNEPTQMSGSRKSDALTRMPVKLEPPTREDSIGRLGHYEVLNIVGFGGMGVVARAFDEQLHRNVAIKVMSERLITSERAQKRFLREARAAASVNHPNVVTIHAVSEKDGIPFLVMEFVDGQSLTDRINHDAPMCLEDVLRIGAQIASGLAAAHRHGIVHRDVKPGNIMLEDGIQRVKLSDFGLARLLVENSDLTSMGDMVGTPSYMSPEQVEGEELTPASDLFSLGCVLYSMFRGSSPFHAGSSYASANRVQNFDPPPVSSFVDGIPPEFDHLMSTLLCKSPKGRPRSAKQVADLLLQWSAQSHQQRMPAHKDATTIRRRQTAKENSSDQALKRAAAVLLALGCLAIGTGIWHWWWEPNRDTSGPTVEAVPASNDTAVPDRLDDGIIEVNPDGGEAETLREALAIAAPHTVIRLSDGIHFGPFQINESNRLEGLRIEGSPECRLLGPLDQPVLQINGVKRVQLDGVTVEASSIQLAIHVSGECEGLTLQNLHLVSKNPKTHRVGQIRFDLGASGSEDEPMQVQDCEFDAGAVAVVIGSHDPSEPPVRHLHVHHNQIRAESIDYGIPVVIQGQVRSILVERNWMSRSRGGISFLFPIARCAERTVVRFNTLSQTDVAAYFNDSDLDQDIRFDDNLIADATQFHTISGDIERYFQWCAENQWVETRSILTPIIKEYFSVLDSSKLQSVLPDSPDYLVPIEGESGNIAGVFAQGG
ncbi:serine/threonine-protein kinase [Rhodopirellula sp. MGV]|uniref:serine/threonine-protein kinase n=1 Tax=Rhodopirellula sp. MGV TaxID=2023130 RepID=UPI000B9695AA|nr:serine/threonine-protein kinase [Rhodopirellula sp. MGV]OYP38812.1 hypothetical protein CGZ80_00885 [Rhodopirellula sp. MGV]PNY37624.1 serine/threonine protein kinase [Rhodopirellula baltica]